MRLSSYVHELITSFVGKFRSWLVELTSFKPKLLIGYIMNKPY